MERPTLVDPAWFGVVLVLADLGDSQAFAAPDPVAALWSRFDVAA